MDMFLLIILSKLKYKMKKLITLLSIIFLVVSVAFSQRDVSGTVQDEGGNPIPGASVIVAGTTNGTVTDIDGNFSISASSDDQLEVSFVGYETQTISVGSQARVVITLSESTEFLDEIVVSGYQTQTRKSLSGAISSVDISIKSLNKSSDQLANIINQVTNKN